LALRQFHRPTATLRKVRVNSYDPDPELRSSPSVAGLVTTSRADDPSMRGFTRSHELRLMANH
jgi:hypothetical protein